MATVAPFGSWESPISAADTVAGVVGFMEPAVDGGDLYWIEARPAEAGRQVLVRRSTDGSVTDLTRGPISVRTSVHEYGGGAYVVRDGTVIYSRFSDQRLYRLDGTADAAPITPEPPRPMSLRYADAALLPDGRIVCIRESHPAAGEAVNEVVAIDPDGDAEIEVVASGRDFYAAPRVSPDGDRLSWLEWDHPNMPWDGTEMVVAPMASPREAERIAGSATESIAEPKWAPDGRLVFASDRSGWWNLYRHDGTAVAPVLERTAEFANPAWVFKQHSYGFLSQGRLLAAFWEDGRHHLGVIDPDGKIETLDYEYSRYSSVVTDGAGKAWSPVYHPHRPSALVEFDIDAGTSLPVRSNPEVADARYAARPQTISFPTSGGDTAHAVFYPPTNPKFAAPDGDRPPLVVKVHGGPTSSVFPYYRTSFQYWTSRGFGLVDVNYRGSTSFGREYRRKLEGQWGVVDVDDCLAAARYLAHIGEADPNKLVITGGSAGGYTTLAALAFGEEFRAGASYYGVADLELLAAHTHKFESRYLDRLVDPGDFAARSPLYHVDDIDVPVVLFQGLDDSVVPPEQAELIAAALERNGIPYAYVTFEGEEHGFRIAENIVTSLETELAFYGEVLGFTPAGELPEVPLVRQVHPDDGG